MKSGGKLASQSFLLIIPTCLI